MKGPTVKGWCPGALRPMETGDGLLVRVRIPGGRLTPAEARAIADLADSAGNGAIDLSHRGNLQIRGVTAGALATVQQALAGLGFLDETIEGEAVRNILVSPFAAEPEMALARALQAALAADRRLHALPGKFGFAIDDTAGSLGTSRADLTARRCADGGWTIFQDGLAVAFPAGEADVLDLLTGFALDFIAARRSNPTLRRLRDCHGAATGSLPPAPPHIGLLGDGFLGVGLAYGRMTAAAFDALVADDVGEIRLTPWRALLLVAHRPQLVLDKAVGLGFLTQASDSRLGMDVCPGPSCCRSAWQPTRGLAEKLAEELAGPVDLHISGCAKVCARRGVARWLVVAGEAGFELYENAAAPSGAPAAVFSSQTVMGGLFGWIGGKT